MIRDRCAGEPGLARLFDPRGIAVVGASADASRPGGQVVHALVRAGYAGGIFPVNPSQPDVAGLRCVASAAHIDAPCDLAVIARPAAEVPGLLRQCGARGMRYAVILGGGFRETGPQGAALEADMLAAARDAGMRLVGPNCIGFISLRTRVFAAFGSLVRPPEIQPGAVSLVSQSGGYGGSIAIHCALAGIGFQHVVSSGNESDLGAADFIHAFVDDPHTRVILAYIEGLSDGRAFMAAARRALQAGKPVVVLKAGNTDAGRTAALSHTASLTGSYDVYRAAFRQCGVIEAHDLDEAADIVKALLPGRLPAGRRIALMGSSGGSAAVLSDAAADNGLSLSVLGESTTALLRSILPPLAAVQNPVDYTAGYPQAKNGADFLQAVDAVLADTEVDSLALVFAVAEDRRLRLAAELLAQAARRSDKPLFAFTVMPETLVGEGLRLLREAGITVLPTPRRLARAAAVLAWYAEARARHEHPAASGGAENGKTRSAEQATLAAELARLPRAAATLDEHDSKRLIAAAGVPVSRDRLLPVGAAPPAEPGEFPLVVKIVSPDITHKTEAGGVRLGVSDPAALEAAVREVVENARKAAPSAKLSGVLLCETISGGLETIVGALHDPCFGPVVMLGLGGTLTEVLRDTTYRVAPFGMEEARAMIGDLRGSALFGAIRGRPARDVQALAEALVNVSTLADALGARLVDLEINPLLVRAQGEGVVALDALARLGEVQAGKSVHDIAQAPSTGAAARAVAQ